MNKYQTQSFAIKTIAKSAGAQKQKDAKHSCLIYKADD